MLYRGIPIYEAQLGFVSAVKLGAVLIVDDDKFIRASLENTLQLSGFEMSGSVGSAVEALAVQSKSPTDVALLDIDLGIGPTGFDLAQKLRNVSPQIGIVFLTTYQDPRFAAISGTNAPKGSRYLVKSEIENFSQIVSAILQAKHRPFSESLSHLNRFSELTDLQIEVWREVSQGISSSEIANRRGISEKSVEATLARIYKILDIKKDKASNPRILLANAFKKYSGKA
jgi:DNA-binding NarL/FixJ family response regulator